jgi:hypothetical protein
MAPPYGDLASLYAATILGSPRDVGALVFVLFIAHQPRLPVPWQYTPPTQSSAVTR